MKPLDYRRCADCHNPSCEGCDNTLNLTRDDLMRLKKREAIITRICSLSNEAESLADILLNSGDCLFQGIWMCELLDRIKDDLNYILDRLSSRMEDAYGYEEDKS